MNALERHAVVGDIGGTHARFGIADIDELRIDHFVSFECANFSSLEDALSAYLRSVPAHPKAISLAIAGPVVDGAVEMTNLPWSVTAEKVRTLAEADRVCLINDFEALALALPYLAHHDFEKIGGGAPVSHAAKAVTGAGTGLGVAGLAWAGDRWTALSGEGGHVAFAGQNDEDFDILKKLGRDIGYVACEHLLSGPGLVRLHRLLTNRPGAPLTAPEIVRLATTEGDPVALHAVRLFAVWLGRFAGDLALLYGARGGVYLGGGIAPKMFTFLSDGHFRTAFESKGQLSEYLADIPVFVIKTPQAGMMGAALAMVGVLDGN